MAYNTRLAEYGDLFAIFRLMVKGQEEAGPRFPRPTAPDGLHIILDRIASRFIWVAYEDTEKGQKIVGTLGMRLSSWEGCPNHQYLEVPYFYVEPEARVIKDGKMVSSMLIEAAKNTSVMTSVAMGHWVPLMLGVNFGGDNAEIKEMLIEKHGFERTGGNFVRIPSEEDLPEEARQQIARAQAAEAAE